MHGDTHLSNPCLRLNHLLIPVEVDPTPRESVVTAHANDKQNNPNVDVNSGAVWLSPRDDTV